MFDHFTIHINGKSSFHSSIKKENVRVKQSKGQGGNLTDKNQFYFDEIMIMYVCTRPTRCIFFSAYRFRVTHYTDS